MSAFTSWILALFMAVNQFFTLMIETVGELPTDFITAVSMRFGDEEEVVL
jgi:hypothetical protein